MKTTHILLRYLLLIACMAASIIAEAQLLRFQEDYKLGYKDSQGHVVVPASYEAGSEMKDGFAIVLKDAKRGYINSKGMAIIPCIYEDAALFEDGLACVQQNGRYGFIDSLGSWIIPPSYENAFSFQNGLARISTGGKWGTIDRNGRVVIAPIYASLLDANDGLLIASVDGRLFGYIDQTGKPVIGFQFLQAFPFDGQTKQAVAETAEGLVLIDRNGRPIRKVANEVLEKRAERGGKWRERD